MIALLGSVEVVWYAISVTFTSIPLTTFFSFNLINTPFTSTRLLKISSIFNIIPSIVTLSPTTTIFSSASETVIESSVTLVIVYSFPKMFTTKSLVLVFPMFTVSKDLSNTYLYSNDWSFSRATEVFKSSVSRVVTIFNPSPNLISSWTS